MNTFCCRKRTNCRRLTQMSRDNPVWHTLLYTPAFFLFLCCPPSGPRGPSGFVWAVRPVACCNLSVRLAVSLHRVTDGTEQEKMNLCDEKGWQKESCLLRRRVSSAWMPPRLGTVPKHQSTDCDTVGQRSPPVNLTNSYISEAALPFWTLFFAISFSGSVITYSAQLAYLTVVYVLSVNSLAVHKDIFICNISFIGHNFKFSNEMLSIYFLILLIELDFLFLVCWLQYFTLQDFGFNAKEKQILIILQPLCIEFVCSPRDSKLSTGVNVSLDGC